jgi:hypothetical protein
MQCIMLKTVSVTASTLPVSAASLMHDNCCMTGHDMFSLLPFSVFIGGMITM